MLHTYSSNLGFQWTAFPPTHSDSLEAEQLRIQKPQSFLSRLLNALLSILKYFIILLVLTMISFCNLYPELASIFLGLAGYEQYLKLLSLIALGVSTLVLAVRLFNHYSFSEREKYEKAYRELQKLYRDLELKHQELKKEAKMYYDLYSQCRSETQRLNYENEILKKENYSNRLQIENLQLEANRLQVEIERIRREVNPPREQLISTYNELVRRISGSRSHLDTTLLDKLLLIAQKSMEQGNTLEAQYLLKLVGRLIDDEEILARLRRLYMIGFASRHVPKPL